MFQQMLTILPQETGTIKVQLKRQLKLRGSALSLNVRPHKILQAANWLVTNSSLYREEGVTLSKDKAATFYLTLLQNHTENQDRFDANDQLKLIHVAWKRLVKKLGILLKIGQRMMQEYQKE